MRFIIQSKRWRNCKKCEFRIEFEKEKVKIGQNQHHPVAFPVSNNHVDDANLCYLEYNVAELIPEPQSACILVVLVGFISSRCLKGNQ